MNTLNKKTGYLMSILALGFVLGQTACTKKSAAAATTDVTVSAEKPSSVIGAVDAAVAQVGNGVASNNAAQAAQGIVQASASEVDSKCDSHGDPIDAQGNRLNDSDANLPAHRFYCKLAKNSEDPDTIQGSYTLVKGIACALEKAGIQFDGQTHSLSVTIGTDCFSAKQVSEMNGQTMTVDVKGSKPAEFNTYYDTGVEMTVPNFGTFRLAAKVTDTKVEFEAMEDQTAISAGKTGTYAASFDKTTGDLRFEGRHDRFSCAEAGSCGWSRHDRIYAKLEMSGEQVVGVSNIEGIASQIQIPSGLNNQYYGSVATVKGNLTTGIKARMYNQSTATSDDLADISKYTEQSNNKCYTKESDSADCGANTGVAMAANGVLNFNMHPAGTVTPTQNWFNSIVGLTFTHVDFSDIQ